MWLWHNEQLWKNRRLLNDKGKRCSGRQFLQVTRCWFKNHITCSISYIKYIYATSYEIKSVCKGQNTKLKKILLFSEHLKVFHMTSRKCYFWFYIKSLVSLIKNTQLLDTHF